MLSRHGEFEIAHMFTGSLEQFSLRLVLRIPPRTLGHKDFSKVKGYSDGMKVIVPECFGSSPTYTKNLDDKLK